MSHYIYIFIESKVSAPFYIALQGSDRGTVGKYCKVWRAGHCYELDATGGEV